MTEAPKRSIDGRRIRLLGMGSDDPNPVEPGIEGRVTLVDGSGTIHVQWDNGRTLGLIPEVDSWELL